MTLAGLGTRTPEARSPSGHLQVKSDTDGRGRSYWAYWRDAEGKRHGQKLGPAHVKDAGRRTPRGAVVWRSGDGPAPTDEHLTPKDAQRALADLLAGVSAAQPARAAATLCAAAEGWLAQRLSEQGLKRSTVADYEDMFERLYRDLGADTPVGTLEQARLREYFAGFRAERVLGEQRALRMRRDGHDVKRVRIERWTARPPGSTPVEVATKAEAERLASEMPGTWKHRRQGAYRVVPLGAQRARRVARNTASDLAADGWAVERRAAERWLLSSPAAAQTRNKYRDILAAVFDFAVDQRWIEANPLAEVRRAGRKQDRERILRRDDFYDQNEVARLLEHAPGPAEQAFWLCGAHAGLRLPGEAQGIRWGAVDFVAGVLRVYDNWVRNAADGTKTSDSAPIPMTPQLRNALLELQSRGYCSRDDDHVFAADARGHPISERRMRSSFKAAVQVAGLKSIPMYNLRHSFGTGLARGGIDVRTISALMRHDRITTTEQYMAYAPQADLAERLARALSPTSALL